VSGHRFVVPTSAKGGQCGTKFIRRTAH
jgi:hypothetical protein